MQWAVQWVNVVRMVEKFEDSRLITFFLQVCSSRIICCGSFWIRFNFGQPDPCSKKISQNQGKFPQKSTKIIRISYFFVKNIKNIFYGHKYYPINNKTDHFLEKYIFFYRTVDISLNLRNGSKDPDPYQNETDPQYWIIQS